MGFHGDQARLGSARQGRGATTCDSRAAAKRAAGDKVEILIDAGFGYGADADRAIRVARKLEELGIYWLEEPFEPDEFEAYADSPIPSSIRVAAGEEEATRWGFRD